MSWGSMVQPGITPDHHRFPPLEAVRQKLTMLRHSHDDHASPTDGTNITSSSDHMTDRQSMYASVSSSDGVQGIVSTYPSTAEGYELQEICGKGSSSKVYKATVKHSGETVAVKVIDLEAYSEHMELVLQEASVMKRQRHPNILELHAAFVSDHFLWMVLPFVSGGSLDMLLKTGYTKGLREVEIATIMKQVLEGLASLHKCGVMHRDIKASNILIGRDGTVCLSDFGVAAKLERRLTGSRSFGKLERRNTFVGSPAYIAPEILTGLDDGYGLPADIYSFGVTVVEVAVGHTPYVDLSFEAMAVNKVNNSTPPLLTVDSHGKRLSTDLGEVVAACLQPEPDKRPSAAQLLKHRFFRTAARDPRHVVQSLWKFIPEAQSSSPPAGSDDGHLLHAASHGSIQDTSAHGASDFNPEAFDATHALGMLKRLLLHGLQEPVSPEMESAPMADVLRISAQDNVIPWLLATAISMCKGMFFGRAEMHGIGLQHMHGAGFLLGRFMGEDGLPVWSGPSYLKIASARAGVGAGRVNVEIIHILANDTALQLFKEGRDVVGWQLPLTEIQPHMNVHSLREYMQKAQADDSRPYVLLLRSREGTTFNLMSILGCALADHESNKRVYGSNVMPGDILTGRMPPPSSFAFKGFTRLVDDLHQVEQFLKTAEPPVSQQASLTRDTSANRRAFPAYSAPRGFYRFGSGSSRGSRQELSSQQQTDS